MQFYLKLKKMSSLNIKNASIKFKLEIENPVLNAIAIELINHLATEWRNKVEPHLAKQDLISVNVDWENCRNKDGSIKNSLENPAQGLMFDIQIALELWKKSLTTKLNKEEKEILKLVSKLKGGALLLPPPKKNVKTKRKTMSKMRKRDTRTLRASTKIRRGRS
jgi:hypothetical protein